MQTSLAEWIKASDQGQQADNILRRCVHCGFCLATCPTYQLTGDELDSPRGRIYLIKQLVEHNDNKQINPEITCQHLDRCLTCLSCQTTCPSGVEYGKLLEIGRELNQQQVKRRYSQQLKRDSIAWFLNQKTLFATSVKLGQFLKPFLPKVLKIIPKSYPSQTLPQTTHNKKVLLFSGCVQPSLNANIDQHTIRVLDRCQIQAVLTKTNQCCGAIYLHLGYIEKAKQQMRHNIDMFFKLKQDIAFDTLITTASACSLMLKHYHYYLANDAGYQQKAQQFSNSIQDISEYLSQKDFPKQSKKKSCAFHASCTLQHGLKQQATVESLLSNAGYQLQAITDNHLCCGSAGTYSLLQPELSQQLRANKIQQLTKNQPDVIATANIGCLQHLQAKMEQRVYHWIELL